MVEQWMAVDEKPEPVTGVRVERHPAIASAETGGRYPALLEPQEVHVLGQTFRLDRLPYLLALEGDKPLGTVSLALYGDDLVLLGFEGQPGLGLPGLCESVLVEADRVGREIGRRRLLAPLTNADPLPLFYLQAEGFSVAEVTTYSGPERRGIAGIVASHELLLERAIVE